VPNTSTITRHPKRAEIEKALLAGTSVRDIARQHGLSHAAVGRYRQEWLAKRDKRSDAILVKHVEQERHRAEDLLQLCNQALDHAQEAIEGAKGEGKWGQAATGIREFTRAVELLARLRGELHSQAQTTVNTTVNFVGDPNWPLVRDLAFRILAPHPELQAEFREGLRALAAPDIADTKDRFDQGFCTPFPQLSPTLGAQRRVLPTRSGPGSPLPKAAANLRGDSTRPPGVGLVGTHTNLVPPAVAPSIRGEAGGDGADVPVLSSAGNAQTYGGAGDDPAPPGGVCLPRLRL
jgi:hypothetical protein